MSDTVYIFFPAAEANPVYQGWMKQLAHPVSIVSTTIPQSAPSG